MRVRIESIKMHQPDAVYVSEYCIATCLCDTGQLEDFHGYFYPGVIEKYIGKVVDIDVYERFDHNLKSITSIIFCNVMGTFMFRKSLCV